MSPGHEAGGVPRPEGSPRPGAGGVPGPLDGLTVLDLTRLLPGGYCTLLLADLGADVIKVEQPGRGDYLRWAPPLVDGESAAHRALNRGKRSITLDLKAAAGRDLLLRLAEAADVLVEGFRPGVMDRLGLGHDELARRNPALVHAAITGYGQDGPYRDLAGHDIDYLAYGGVLALSPGPDGRPVPPGVQVGDLGGGGLTAAVGILAALLERGRTGRGRFVDVSMLDGVLSWLSIHLANRLAAPGDPAGTVLSGRFACYRVYGTADGRWVAVGALEPRFWHALCEALGCEDLVEHQFDPDRQDEMAARLESAFRTRTRDEWTAVLAGVEACVAPVNDPLEAARDPQVRHRGMVVSVDGVPVGPGSPVRLGPGPSPSPATTPAPALGGHTDEVLRAAGLGPQEIEALRRAGVV